jgi:hypothetical protein
MYVTPAYYDVALSGKFTRDEESAEMLEIIRRHRVYDFGMTYTTDRPFRSVFLACAEKQRRYNLAV